MRCHASRKIRDSKAALLPYLLLQTPGPRWEVLRIYHFSAQSSFLQEPLSANQAIQETAIRLIGVQIAAPSWVCQSEVALLLCEARLAPGVDVVEHCKQ